MLDEMLLVTSFFLNIYVFNLFSKSVKPDIAFISTVSVYLFFINMYFEPKSFFVVYHS